MAAIGNDFKTWFTIFSMRRCVIIKLMALLAGGLKYSRTCWLIYGEVIRLALPEWIFHNCFRDFKKREKKNIGTFDF